MVNAQLSFNQTLRNYQGFFIWTIIIFISGVAIIKGIIPGVNAVQKFYDDNKVLAAENEQTKKRLQILENLDENVLSDQINTLISAIPADKNLATIFSTVEYVSSVSGVTVTNFSIQSVGTISTASAVASSTNNLLKQNMLESKVSIEGTIDQVKNFLDTIINVRRLMNISQITVDIGKTGLAQGSFVLQSFFAPLPKTLGKPTDPLTALSGKDEELMQKISAYPSALQNANQIPVLQPGNKIDPFLH
jgi:hypothetical protein